MNEVTKFVLYTLAGLFSAAYLLFMFWLIAKLVTIMVKDKFEDKDKL
jgi:hypothetical protein